MIPLAVPDLSGNEARYLQECVESTFVSSVGPFIPRFEALVARASGVERAAATSSGTCALHLAFLAAGVTPGSLVLCPSFTFIATANAIAHCGALPWLFDVDPASWSLDADFVRGFLERETRREGGGLRHTATGRRVSALAVVDILGCPAHRAPLSDLAREFGLPVVADAAAAIGTTYRGAPLGPLADYTCYSFNGNKTVTCGGGGAVVSPDPDKVAAIKHLSGQARLGERYEHDRVGFNYRMTNLEAAVGVAQMERLPDLLAAKRRIDAAYRAGISPRAGLGFFPSPDWAESGAWFSGITVDKTRLPPAASLKESLAARGIQAGLFWMPVHLQAPFADAPRTPMPVCEALWEKILVLPCSTGLRRDEQQTVLAAVNDLLGESR